jgi:hypothetical protein
MDQIGHGALKCGFGIVKSKIHNVICESPLRGGKNGLVSILLVDMDLVSP